METKTEELIIVDPAKFGLKEDVAKNITKGLDQIIRERDVLVPQYDAIIKMDINDPATWEAAAALNKLVKNNRTKGIEPWHKSTKDYWLKGGQFVDAIKRKEIAENDRMEEALDRIAKHAEYLEKERLLAIRNEREEKIAAYEYDFSKVDLSAMDEEMFNVILAGAKSQYEEKQKELIRAQETEKEMKDRWNRLFTIGLKFNGSGYVFENDFGIVDVPNVDILTWDKETFDLKFEECKAAKLRLEAEQDKKNKETALANEKLKKDKEALEAKTKAEKEKNEALDKRFTSRSYLLIQLGFTITPDGVFMFSIDGKMPDIMIDNLKVKFDDDKQFQTILENATADVNALKAVKQKKDAAAEKEKQEKIKAEADAKAKADLEAKQKAEADAAAKKKAAEEKEAAKAPRKTKLTNWVDAIHTNTPQAIEDDELVKIINAKHEAFKKWAKDEINKL